MANKFINTALIARESLFMLENNTVLAKRVNRSYEDRFAKTGAKVDSSIGVRLPNNFTVNKGPNLNVQDIEEKSVQVVMDQQAHVDFEISSVDLTLSVDDFSERYLNPAINNLVNEIESEGLQKVKKFSKAVEFTGEEANKLKVFLSAKASLERVGVPSDNFFTAIISPDAQAELVASLNNAFNPAKTISDQYKTGNMGTAAGCAFSMSQNLDSHTFGSGIADPIKVNGATQTANVEAGKITVDGLTGALNAGDTFTIAGVFELNPISLKSTGKLKQFVVTENVTAGGTEIKFSPAMVLTGSRKNVSGVPANDADIKFMGVAGKTVSLGFLFHKDALALVSADLVHVAGTDRCANVSSSRAGVALRVIKDYINGTDKLVCRIDVLYGWSVLREDFGVKIYSHV